MDKKLSHFCPFRIFLVIKSFWNKLPGHSLTSVFCNLCHIEWNVSSTDTMQGIKYSIYIYRLSNVIWTNPHIIITTKCFCFLYCTLISRNTINRFHRISVNRNDSFVYSARNVCAHFIYQWIWIHSKGIVKFSPGTIYQNSTGAYVCQLHKFKS